MPFSGPQFDEAFRQVIDLIQPATVFEVGPGNGKYARIIRGMIDSPHPVTIHAVEIEPSYIERFHLRDFYDVVSVGRGSDVMRQQGAADAQWDVVVLGDVLEHMPKSEGMDLLNYFVYRANWLWLRWPAHYIQGAWEGIESESHISVWGVLDVHTLRTRYIKLQQGPAEAFVVQGYRIADQDAWKPLFEALRHFEGLSVIPGSEGV